MKHVVLLALILSFSTMVPVAPAAVDVNYPDGSFRFDIITRAEEAWLLTMLCAWPLSRSPLAIGSINNENWVNHPVVMAVNAGLVKFYSIGTDVAGSQNNATNFTRKSSKDRDNEVENDVGSIIKDVTPPFVIDTDPGDGDEHVPPNKEIIVHFNEEVEAGDAYQHITVKNSGGTTIPIDKKINGDMLVIRPVDGLVLGAPVNGTITVNFSMELRNAENIPVQITGGGDTKTFYASVRGNQMAIPFTGLKYGVDYDLVIPGGSVQSSASGTDNENIKLNLKWATQGDGSFVLTECVYFCYP